MAAAPSAEPSTPPYRGAALVGAGSLFWNGVLLLVRLARHLAGWPELPLWALSNAASLLVFLASMALRRPAWPGRKVMGWCVIRGLCTTCSVVFTMFAVRCGVDLGDFAALMSVSVAAASVMGWLLCNEKLTAVHLLAVACNVAGSLLIAKPKALFGGAGPSAPWYAYALSLLNGLADAGIYVCSRKTPGTDPRITLSVATFATPVALVLYAWALGEGAGAVQLLEERPLEGLGWVLGTSFVALGAMVSFTVGSQWCPASASATVDTAVRMASGYALDLALFHAKLNGLQSSGAALMLCAVCLMTLATEAGVVELTQQTGLKRLLSAALPRQRSGGKLRLSGGRLQEQLLAGSDGERRVAVLA